MNKRELQEKYSELSNSELLEIIDQKFDYTELAITVAIEELGKRKISEDDIKDYKDEVITQVNTLITKNIIDDLTLAQKNLFFFLWLPFLTFPLKQNLRDDGFVLKLKQANYYSLVGFCSFLAAGFIISILSVNDLVGLGIWILTFLPAYFFDEHFNRQRIVSRLRSIFGEQKDEENSDY